MTWQEDAEALKNWLWEETAPAAIEAALARVTERLSVIEHENANMRATTRRIKRLNATSERAEAAEQRVAELEAALRRISEGTAMTDDVLRAFARAALGEGEKSHAPPENPSNRLDKRGHVL